MLSLNKKLQEIGDKNTLEKQKLEQEIKKTDNEIDELVLLKENPKPKGMDKLILLIEHKKINTNVGMIKGEILKDGKIVLTGSMTCMPKKSTDSFDWDMLNNGESFFDGFSVDYGKETIGSIIKEGLKNSIKEGKIPFFQK